MLLEENKVLKSQQKRQNENHKTKKFTETFIDKEANELSDEVFQELSQPKLNHNLNKQQSPSFNQLPENQIFILTEKLNSLQMELDSNYHLINSLQKENQMLHITNDENRDFQKQIEQLENQLKEKDSLVISLQNQLQKEKLAHSSLSEAHEIFPIVDELPYLEQINQILKENRDDIQQFYQQRASLIDVLLKSHKLLEQFQSISQPNTHTIEKIVVDNQLLLQKATDIFNKLPNDIKSQYKITQIEFDPSQFLDEIFSLLIRKVGDSTQLISSYHGHLSSVVSALREINENDDKQRLLSHISRIKSFLEKNSLDVTGFSIFKDHPESYILKLINISQLKSEPFSLLFELMKISFEANQKLTEINEQLEDELDIIQKKTSLQNNQSFNELQETNLQLEKILKRVFELGENLIDNPSESVMFFWINLLNISNNFQI